MLHIIPEHGTISGFLKEIRACIHPDGSSVPHATGTFSFSLQEKRIRMNNKDNVTIDFNPCCI
jgi:hypothetical protein